MGKRFTELDGLRGIAALAVVFSHFTGIYNFKYDNAPKPFIDFSIGAFGVQLFFLISGFVILMTAQRSTKVSDFVISRVSRLYPAYWISLIVVVIVSIAFAVPKMVLSPLVVALNFTMIQRWFLVPNVVDVYWTLAVEMQFYVIIFLILLFTKAHLTTRVIQYLVYSWLVISVAVSIWASPYSQGISSQAVVLPVRMVLNVTLSEFGPLFCLGMFAYLARNKAQKLWLVVFPLTVAILNAGLLHDWWYALTVAILSFVFLIVIAREQTRVLTTKPFLFFGKISYSMYIIHSIPGYIVITLALPYIGRNWAILAAIIVSTLLAWGLHQIGEVKGTALLKAGLLKIRGT